MRQAAAAANQAERLQQASEERALLEMQYLRREGDARLAALNTRREPGTQDMQDRARNDDDDGLEPIQFDDPPPAYLQSVPGLGKPDAADATPNAAQGRGLTAAPTAAPKVSSTSTPEAPSVCMRQRPGAGGWEKKRRRLGTAEEAEQMLTGRKLKRMAT
ncbi:hypothetical protein MMC31_003355 [Peltigera leucophlebia]|nr:hypothetical protein [Peltigera leucophlebia]